MDISRLVLGTAQFGMEYGVTNVHGKVAKSEIAKILLYAKQIGLKSIDTASAYADSEEIIGTILDSNSEFRIITKLPPNIVSSRDVKASINLAFRKSMSLLGYKKTYGLLAHRSSDLLKSNGYKVWETLLSLKDLGLVKKIGATVYSGEEIDNLIQLYPIDIIQLPCNILDQRLIKSGHLNKLHNMGIEVHIRSVFLQGVLLQDPMLLPKFFQPYLEKLNKLKSYLDLQNITQLSACVSFLNNLPGANHLVIGVSSFKEFNQIVDVCKDTTEIDLTDFAVDDQRLLNPSLWKV